MRALVLFKGTGSIDKALEAAGWEVHSIDIDPKCEASETCDILAWDPSKFDVGHFDFIWASPVCTEFSTLLLRRPRRLELGDSFVQRALLIIETLKPRWWVLENPQTGLLKTRPYMQGLPFVDVDYCKFGFGYRKRTRLWGNVRFCPMPLCKKGDRCRG
jgi:site-specific DNA-cytosine methylase